MPIGFTKIPTPRVERRNNLFSDLCSHLPLFIDLATNRGDFQGMDMDELFAKRPDDSLSQLIKEDLGVLSVDELRERAAILAGEIERVNQKIQASVNFRASANHIFKSSGT